MAVIVMVMPMMPMSMMIVSIMSVVVMIVMIMMVVRMRMTHSIPIGDLRRNANKYIFVSMLYCNCDGVVIWMEI